MMGTFARRGNTEGHGAMARVFRGKIAMPLDDHDPCTRTSAILFELDAPPRVVLGWPICGVHDANRLGDLLAVRRTRLFERFLEDPPVALAAETVLRHPRLAGPLLEVGDQLLLSLLGPVRDDNQHAFHEILA